MTTESENNVLLTPWESPGPVVRYADYPLPAHRYLPGINERPDGLKIPVSAAFAYGVDLFNHGCWWEAHEIWEDVWLDQPQQSLNRLAMAVLINAANLNLKITLGKPNAAHRLERDIAERFDEWTRRGGETLFGVDVSHWCGRYLVYIKKILDDPRPAHARPEFPFLAIEWP
ncbi:MAG: DUF309 domain-containing protein [Fimbriimonadaceae bacterium]|nr:DUF309 domain-containing protein [Alphaproteobacteria bacterium]